MTWREKAACLGADTRLFFPPSGGTSAPAKQICGECPVAVECLDWSLPHAEFGVFGGMSAKERARERRRRKIRLVAKSRI